MHSRKAIGARRAQLVQQFIGESVCLTAIAFLLAVGLVETTLPIFSRFAGKEVAFAYGDAQVLMGLAGVLLGTGILAGSYPAFFLSGLRPVENLRRNSAPRRSVSARCWGRRWPALRCCSPGNSPTW